MQTNRNMFQALKLIQRSGNNGRPGRSGISVVTTRAVRRTILVLGSAGIMLTQLGPQTPAQAQDLIIGQNETFGCLTIDDGSRVGSNGAGRNVIAWPVCNDGITQTWVNNQGLLQAFVNGRTYCLDVDQGAPRGQSGRGLNVIAWPSCHGGQNQLWYSGERRTVRSALTNGCLTTDRNSTAHNGMGHNVILWPNCHGGDTQKWLPRTGTTPGYQGGGDSKAEQKEAYCRTLRPAAWREVCLSRYLTRLDGELNDVYAGLRNAYGSGGEGISLRNSQRDWIRFRNNCGRNVDCITRAYERRIQNLKQGNWMASHSGYTGGGGGEGQNAAGCGWYAIYSCHRSRSHAQNDQQWSGYGFVVDTNQVPNFRNGYYCLANRASSRRQAQQFRRQAHSQFPSAYIKKGC